jgi:hypothetical protein
MRLHYRTMTSRVRGAQLLTAAVVAGLLTACTSPDDRAAPSDTPPAPAAGVMDEPASGSDARSAPASSVLGLACLSGDPTVGESWRVQELPDTLTELPLVQLAGLPMRDSTRLAARITRTADVLPADTSVADFRGLPLAIRDAWILMTPEQDTVVIALVSRRLPIESAPLEEFLTVIISPDPAPSARGAMRALWHVRDAGEEERLITYEPIAALRTPDASVRILLVRESAGRPQVVMLGRNLRGGWERAWEGELPVCP